MKVFLFFVSILSLSQAANLIRYSQASAEILLFWRLFLASLILGVLHLFLTSKNEKLKELRKINLKTYLLFLASGFIFFLHLWAFFYAAQNTSIANCVIIFSTNPIFTALLSLFVTKEKFSKRLIVVYFFGMLGLYFLFKENMKLEPHYLFGNLFALVAALLFSSYVTLANQLRKNISNSLLSSLIYMVSAVCFACSALFKGLSFFDFTPQAFYSLIGLIIFPTLLGHALFMYLMKSININWLSCGKLLEPSLASLVALSFFNEKINSSMIYAYIFSSISVLFLLDFSDL